MLSRHSRILLLIGGLAAIAIFTVAGVFIATDSERARIQVDDEASSELQSLGDELWAAVDEQQAATYEYLLAADPQSLSRYRQAVVNQLALADQIAADATLLPDVLEALAAVAVATDEWRARFAEPAIAAVEGGSLSERAVAARAADQSQERAGEAVGELVLRMDGVDAVTRARSRTLNATRMVWTAISVGIQLVAAALSLWFVRRYGLLLERDARRRERAGTERTAIVASLRSLRARDTPEATASAITEALARLPGIDAAGVLEFRDDAVIPIAASGADVWPLRIGEHLPTARARYLIGRSAAGPWAEATLPAAEPTAYQQRLSRMDIKGVAYAPITVGDDTIALIVVATTDAEHRQHLVEDAPAVAEFASLAEAILAPAMVVRREQLVAKHRIGAVIESAAFRPVFQPVIDLASGGTVGFEALTRFDDRSAPDQMFAAALGCGLGVELETATLEVAIRESRALPPRAWLSVNVSPTLLGDVTALNRLLRAGSRPVVLEITEHEAIANYRPLREALRRLTPEVRLAVDDVGAGVANFTHLVELRPDFVKIDAGLVRGVNLDPGRQAVVAGLVHFAGVAGCAVIAEGIETDAELATVTDLGVTLGQGYLLARAAPATTWGAHPPARLPDGALHRRRQNTRPRRAEQPSRSG